MLPRASQAAHFERNPSGRGQLAVFPRCSLDPYEFRYGRFARALKNRQLTDGGVTIIWETVHWGVVRSSAFADARPPSYKKIQVF